MLFRSSTLEPDHAVGGIDVFLARYSKSGTLKWLKQYGTSVNDDSVGKIVVLANGDSYIAGSTKGSWPDQTHLGSGAGNDVFVAKISGAGTMRWVRQYGTEAEDYATALGRSPSGDLYLAVEATVAMPSNRPDHPNSYGGGSLDGAVMKFDKNGTWKWKIGRAHV